MKLKRPVRKRLEAVLDRPPGTIAAACGAPFVTMSFQPSGDVFACCRKPAVVLGNITRERLGDIWGNEIARDLRSAMRAFDLPAECGVCEWHIRRDAITSADLYTYRPLAVRHDNPAWPQRLEFSLSNACNLQCVHCSGELSSAIRAKRERLPPLPRVYGDQFFDDLAPFLTHLSDATFLGGEPFLQRECFRIWDQMIAARLSPRCLITTSGAIYNDRVARVLDQLRVDLSVSLDGARPETVEAVRVGARWDDLMANLACFREHLDGRGRLLLTFSLLTLNWHELPEFLLLAESLGAAVWLNRVTHPPHLSLRSLDQRELRAGLAALERRSARLVPQLAINSAVWEQALVTIRMYASDGGAQELAVQLREGSGSGDIRHLRRAWALVDEGWYDDALRAAAVDVSGIGARADLARVRARVHRVTGEPARALREAEACVTATPMWTEAYVERALCHLVSGDVGAAERDLATAGTRFVAGDDATELALAAAQVTTQLARTTPARAVERSEQILAAVDAESGTDGRHHLQVAAARAHRLDGEVERAAELLAAALVMAPTPGGLVERGWQRVLAGDPHGAHQNLVAARSLLAATRPLSGDSGCLCLDAEARRRLEAAEVPDTECALHPDDATLDALADALAQPKADGPVERSAQRTA